MPREISEEGRRVTSADVKDLYEKKHRSLVMYSFKLSGGDMDLAQDLVSSVYQKLIQRRPVLFKRSLEHYAYSAVRNGFLDSLKRLDHNSISLSNLDDRAIEGIDELAIEPLEFIPSERKEMKRTIRKLVSEMPPSDREAFSLCIFEGLTYEEAMKRSGRTRGALKMSVSRAYKKLVENLSTKGVQIEERIFVNRSKVI
jgi:RNA polymerase sigma factor (sigma-70 family)